MKKEDIHLADLSRILFGEAPPLFLAEVFLWMVWWLKDVNLLRKSRSTSGKTRVAV